MRALWTFAITGILAGASAMACQPLQIIDLPTDAPSSVMPPTVPKDVFSSLPAADDAKADLCAPDNDVDRVTIAFCKPDPGVHGLSDLLHVLGLDFQDPNGANGAGGNPGFALLGHSSALTARKISSITPTAFVFTPPVQGKMPADFTWLAFDPGEHFVELASNAPPTPDNDGGLNFYILLFDTPCLDAPAGCGWKDTLTPSITTGWTNVRVYEDDGPIGNTIAACQVCHDPENEGERMLRMQEIKPPFTHWMSPSTEGGRALLDDFHAAHGHDEDYGPIPAAMIDESDPALMAKAIGMLGFGDQPNVFDSAEIEAEVQASSPSQPASNLPLGGSPSWRAIYEGAVAGEFIAAPYHDVKVTDPVKLAVMSDAYRRFKDGSATDLPNIQDVMLDEGLRDMGFAPKKGLNGKELLQQVCQECHNSSLDPEVTRDRFRVDELDRMSVSERKLAILRLGYPNTTVLTMPPPLFRTVTPDERQLMIEELMKPPTKK